MSHAYINFIQEFVPFLWVIGSKWKMNLCVEISESLFFCVHVADVIYVKNRYSTLNSEYLQRNYRYIRMPYEIQ